MTKWNRMKNGNIRWLSPGLGFPVICQLACSTTDNICKRWGQVLSWKKKKKKKLTVFMLFIGPVQKLKDCFAFPPQVSTSTLLKHYGINLTGKALFCSLSRWPHSKGSQLLKKRFGMSFKNPEELFPKATQGKTPRESSGYLEELRCS